MFLSLEKMEARTKELDSLRFVDMTPVTPMDAMEDPLGPDEVHKGIPGEITGTKLELGDEFVGRDRYLWVQKKVRVPARREGCQAAARFNFGETGGGHNSGFESLLYLNGKPYQGVDTNHNDVLLEDYAGEEATLTFMLWTGLEGGGPKREFRHRVREAHVGYLHEATDQLYYFSRAIAGTVRLLPEESTQRYQLTAAMEGTLGLLNWDKDKFYDTVGPALSYLMEELGKLEKHTDVTVNVVGHTHIDVAWLWRLKHTREKAMRSFSTVLRLMEEFDEYIFLQTQPQLYKYVKNDCPELYERIKARVADGRWEADGGMWLEADCNISSGEALARQLLHGVTFLKEEFGHSCEFLWLPDVFGYSWALPQILKQANIKTFMTTKISWNQFNSIPNDLFRWRGIDGTEILTYFITTPDDGCPVTERFATYNGMLTPHTVDGSWKKFKNKAISNETLISYGYGDGGGGVNRDMLKMRRAMEKLPGLPNVKTSTARDFFDRIHTYADQAGEETPVWDGELYLEFHRGTYTSQANNKKQNRRLELGLSETEWLSSLSYLLGGSYPSEILHDGWETILRNQFHDIIPGSSITEVYVDSQKEYAGVAADLAAVTKEALDCRQAADGSYTVYHSGSFDRSDLVFIPETADGSFADQNGPLPAQKVKGGYLVGVTLAPLELRTVKFLPQPGAEAASPFQVEMEKGSAETPYYSIRWNEEGQLTRIYDKKNSREVLAPGKAGNLLEVFEDKPLQYDNWDIDIFYMQKRELASLACPPELLENGPLCAAVRFQYRYNKSTITQDMRLYSDTPRIDFATQVEWQEDHRLLKAAFPVDVRSTKATYDIQYGHVERPTHYNTSWDYARFEVVAHKWGDLSEENYGVALLNDCKYGYNVHDGVIKLSLLKSGKFPDTQADLGRHTFTYALLPHAGGPARGGVIEEATKLNLPVRLSKGESKLDGKRLIRLSSADVVVDAVKKAEKEDCIVLRIHECRGGRGKVTITSDFPLASYVPCNLLEENTGDPVSANAIDVTLKPFEIATFKLTFKK